MNRFPFIGRILAATAIAAAFAAILWFAFPHGAQSPAIRNARPGATTPVDYDLTRMNSQMRAGMAYRLLALPSELEGKTFRISGTFLVAKDEDGGADHLGCLIEVPAPCACCAQSGVVEFVRKEGVLPQVEDFIVLSGRLKMCESGNERRSLVIPKLVDAVIE
ncbi:MAG: hypothetical protein K6F50_03760 [Kiritimatiellae bacterium]|nr:hypothetical protein [Kiritimatiellia bacterium]